MTNSAFQSVVEAMGGVVMFLVALGLARRQLLSLRYGLGWMAVAVLLVVAAVGLFALGGVPKSLPFTPTGAITGIGLACVLALMLQLSISLSGHQEAIRQLSEANALLEERLARLERLGDQVSEEP